MRTVIVAAVVLAIGVFPTRADHGGQLFFTAVIDGSQVVPPTVSPGTGFGCVSLNPIGDPAIDFNITFSGLLAPETVAHFYGPAPIGENAFVQIGLPLGSPKVGNTITISTAQRFFLMTGQLYINIHSSLFPDGEIRGQLLPALTPCETVPVEETTWGRVKALYQ